MDGFRPFMYFSLLFIKILLQGPKLLPKYASLLTKFHSINFFVFQYLEKLVKFFNKLCYTIVLHGIQRLIVFFSQLLHIKTGGALQGW